MLRRVFGVKRQEVTGELRQLRNEDFHDWYFSQIIFWLYIKETCATYTYGGEEKWLKGFGW